MPFCTRLLAVILASFVLVGCMPADARYDEQVRSYDRNAAAYEEMKVQAGGEPTWVVVGTGGKTYKMVAGNSIPQRPLRGLPDEYTDEPWDPAAEQVWLYQEGDREATFREGVVVARGPMRAEYRDRLAEVDQAVEKAKRNAAEVMKQLARERAARGE